MMNTRNQTLAWIKRRARAIQAFYRVSRHVAVREAWLDWVCFQGAQA